MSPSPSIASAHPLRTALLLGLLTVLCLAPFVTKAVHVDDYLFIRSAERILERPTDPFGVWVNWGGLDQPLADITQNPPGACYYLAAAGALCGWSETALHLAFMLPAALAIVGTYFLARRFCAQPAVAAIITLVSPVFWVSATTLMCDVPMLALWIWAILCWMRGLEQSDHRWLAAAALLVALAALTKYFGAALIPLLLAYTLVRERRWSWRTAWLALPVLALLAYEWGVTVRYGHGMLAAAGNYARRESGEVLSWRNALVACSFTGGCLLPVLFLAPRLCSWKGLVAGLMLAGGLALALPQAGTLSECALWENGSVRWSVVLQVAILATGGAGLLVLVVADGWRHRDPAALLLGLWALGTLCFAGVVNWTINGRSLLPLAPVAAILLVRRLELRHPTGRWPRLWPLLPAAAVAAAVAYADAAFAEGSRTAAAELTARSTTPATGELWFQGHWGFQYYMEAGGAWALQVFQPRSSVGDKVILPRHNTSTVNLHPAWFHPVGKIERTSCRWLATMQMEVGAGFYSNRWGPLPYAFGRVPPQVFEIWQMHWPDGATDGPQRRRE